MPEARRSHSRPAQSARFSPRTRPVVPPIHQSVTYFLDDEAYKDVQAGGLDEIWYGRFRNPTVDVAAEEVGRLEAAEAAFMTSSGMGAIATTLLTLLRAGDRVVGSQPGVRRHPGPAGARPAGWGFDVVQVDALDLDAWRAAVAGGPTRVVYVETLANPQLDLADLPAIAEVAHEAGALLVVDNTFATPYSVQPLTLGADVVVHSATKFLNGHSDAIAGVVAGGFDRVREVQRRVITLGTCLDPHAAYLVWRGLQTFELRLARSNATARLLAAPWPRGTTCGASATRRCPATSGPRSPRGCCAATVTGPAPGHGDVHGRRRRRAGAAGDEAAGGRLRGHEPGRGRDPGEHAVQLLALLADAGGAPGGPDRRRHDPGLVRRRADRAAHRGLPPRPRRHRLSRLEVAQASSSRSTAAVTCSVDAVPPTSPVRVAGSRRVSSMAAISRAAGSRGVEVLEHERGGPQHADGVGQALACDVGRRPVDRLEHGRVLARWGRGWPTARCRCCR